MIQHKRIVVYVPEQDYDKLKQKLATVGQSASFWFRKVIRKFLDEK